MCVFILEVRGMCMCSLEVSGVCVWSGGEGCVCGLEVWGVCVCECEGGWRGIPLEVRVG